MTEVDAAALIVAAGRGTRAGAGAPKQYRPIRGVCALARSIEAAAAQPAVGVVLAVIADGDAALFDALRARLSPEARAKLLEPAAGGAERQASVRLGLEALERIAPRRVAIHDAARPFTPPAVWRAALAAVADGGVAACPALPVADTLRRGDADGFAAELRPRDGLHRAQTPQCFDYATILDAHRAQSAEPATDDAEIARRAGATVALTIGHEDARKLTTRADFVWAEDRAGAEGRPDRAETRFGQGFDVHAFGENADGSSDHVMLCGVRVPHESGFLAHSDGDVGLHALTDAVLGACAAGDIGRHFPPTDPLWRGAASDQFLSHAVALAGAMGQSLAHVDVTLICERPKIGPLSSEMRARIAEICGLSVHRVSVKATTTERLGFTGRREGVAAMATATVSGPPLDPEEMWRP